MEPLLFTGLSNALLAAGLALVAFAVSRISRSAPLRHFLWTLVLLKLLTPPVLEIDLRPAARFLWGENRIPDPLPQGGEADLLAALPEPASVRDLEIGWRSG